MPYVNDNSIVHKCLLPCKERPRRMDVEELDKRSHEESRNYRADAYDSRNLRHALPAGKKQCRSQNDAHKICADPHILELAFLPCIADDKRHRIIGGHAEICRHVEGRSQTDDHHSEGEAQQPDRHGRIDNDRLQEFISKLCYIPQQEEVI